MGRWPGVLFNTIITMIVVIKIIIVIITVIIIISIKIIIIIIMYLDCRARLHLPCLRETGGTFPPICCHICIIIIP